MAERIDVSRTRPQGYANNNGEYIPDSFSDEAFRGQYDTLNNLTYKGFARPGSPTSAQVWQIAQLNYDTNNNIISILWPVNALGVPSNDYEFIWDNRLSYVYA